MRTMCKIRLSSDLSVTMDERCLREGLQRTRTPTRADSIHDALAANPDGLSSMMFSSGYGQIDLMRVRRVKRKTSKHMYEKP